MRLQAIKSEEKKGNDPPKVVETKDKDTTEVREREKYMHVISHRSLNN